MIHYARSKRSLAPFYYTLLDPNPLMINKAFRPRTHLLIVICIYTSSLVGGTNHFKRSAAAQAVAPVLISEATSTRAVALDAVARLREPFPLAPPVPFSSDKRTRVMLFAMNLGLQPGESATAVTADAEDETRRIYPLTVEHVGPVPGQEWVNSVIVRLHDEMGDTGDVLIRIRHRGVASNRVRVGIGHTGGGPPDDPGAVPTPGPLAEATPAANGTAGTLTSDEVRTVITQAVSAAVQMNLAVTVAVTDREGNVLGVFTMTGAPTTAVVPGNFVPATSGEPLPNGLGGVRIPSSGAATSKAGTAAFFSTTGNAFTTRTAGFIVQQHFPPGVTNRPGGPLFGVQFSSLPCSDIKRPGLPVAISADPGSVPLYKNGVAVGGVGIEGNGVYSLDPDPTDFDLPFEEVIAVAAGRGFEPPPLIRGDNILVDGIRLPYVNVREAPPGQAIPFANLPGQVSAGFPIRGAQTSAFMPATVGGISGEVDGRFFPFIGSPSASPNALTAADVGTIIAQGAQQANITRAAIRQPLGSSARVSISVVDTEGTVLGIFRTADAPVFGFDVSVQKARSTMFFSRQNTATLLRGAGASFGSYVDRAAGDGVRLDGSVAFSDRAVGFLHRPFFPDDIDGNPPGPFSKPITEWSPFNVGLQLDLLTVNLGAALGAGPCTPIPILRNGLQIFAGGVPLYKNGALVGAIGISGDGIDQDDIIASAGSRGYVAPAAMRADQVFVRGVRLPFVKFPRSPNL